MTWNKLSRKVIKQHKQLKCIVPTPLCSTLKEG
uniref:Uncharacterized protein n=1 Tax=Anguilla anguilla TaxID=7936 RepID=A0A0E9VXA2_ANGAN